MRALRVPFFIAILVSGLVASPAAADAPGTYSLPVRVATPRARSDLEAQVLALINRERQKAGVPPLAPNAALRAAARGHGVEMFIYGYLSHTSRNGASPVDRVERAGVQASMVGENLAYAASVLDAHRRLMASPLHRRNILSPDFHRVGIGVLDGGSRGLIVVETFTD